MAVKFGSLIYQCNICGAPCITPASDLSREEASCVVCGSCPRYRALISLLSRELYGCHLPLADFPVRKDIVGAGMTDWDEYAKRLEEKFSYTNTYYHKAPKLDITDPDPAMFGTLDFLISTEVFEHVAPPVSVAFQNARRLLKENGVMIFTVPFATAAGARTVEHFPNLHQFTIEERDGGQRLINRTEDGRTETFDDIVFHGGQGFALEMRLFSEESLLEEFRQAGFGEVEVIREPDYEAGVYWREPWSKPMVARATTRRAVIEVETTAQAAAELPPPALEHATIPTADSSNRGMREEIRDVEIEVLKANLEALRGELNRISKTRMWQFARAYWAAADRLKQLLGKVPSKG